MEWKHVDHEIQTTIERCWTKKYNENHHNAWNGVGKTMMYLLYSHCYDANRITEWITIFLLRCLYTIHKYIYFFIIFILRYSFFSFTYYSFLFVSFPVALLSSCIYAWSFYSFSHNNCSYWNLNALVRLLWTAKTLICYTEFLMFKLWTAQQNVYQ